ncbi:MAG: hypothetical protein IJD22_00545 [Clostridia bacterium]|nr:hypothetical protein [Clostridia bacterium]
MIRSVGALLLLLCAALWGIERGRREKTALRIIAELVNFIEYTREQISNFRTPLLRIYSEYCCEARELEDFFSALRRNDTENAVGLLSERIPKSAYREASLFFSSLGGGYSEGQESLCIAAKARLERIGEEMRESLGEKLRMYRLLPLLLAASLVILLI